MNSFGPYEGIGSEGGNKQRIALIRVETTPPLLTWVNERQQRVSPFFTSQKCAEAYVEAMPILTDEQWESEGEPEAN